MRRFQSSLRARRLCGGRRHWTTSLPPAAAAERVHCGWRHFHKWVRILSMFNDKLSASTSYPPPRYPGDICGENTFLTGDPLATLLSVLIYDFIRPTGCATAPCLIAYVLVAIGGVTLVSSGIGDSLRAR